MPDNWPYAVSAEYYYLPRLAERLEPNPPWANRIMLAFLSLKAKALEFNPLPILARAVNAITLRIPIRQPCWSARRWRSVT